MARDHARINLDLWGDDDWMDLTVDAQMLYMTLYTSPGLSFCGSGEWQPARLSQRAADWTVDRIEDAAAELSRKLFLVIDLKTDEYLLRSWIKHDGLWRTPNMAVTVANARGDLASRVLRGVIVFEVLKLRTANPDSSSWDRPAVQKMLSQKAVDAESLEPFNPGPNGGPKGVANPGSNPAANPCGHPDAKGGSKGGATPAPTPAPTDKRRGYVSTEGDCDSDELPPPFCSDHPNGTSRPCHACGVAKERRATTVKQRRDDELRRRRELRDNCPSCHGTNWIIGTDPAIKCDHQEAAHA